MLYNAIVARITKKQFEAVNQRDFAGLLKDAHPNIHHRFGGDHALGGNRNDRDAFGRWLERLARVYPRLILTVRDIWVKGLPWDTIVIIRWTAADTLADGSAYENHGVHIIRMKWFKVVEIDANEDSQAVARAMRVALEHGNEEAGMPPIVS